MWKITFFAVLAALFFVGNAQEDGGADLPISANAPQTSNFEIESPPCCLCGTYPDCVAPTKPHYVTDLNMGSYDETCAELDTALQTPNGGFPGGCELHASQFSGPDECACPVMVGASFDELGSQLGSELESEVSGAGHLGATLSLAASSIMLIVAHLY